MQTPTYETKQLFVKLWKPRKRGLGVLEVPAKTI